MQDAGNTSVHADVARSQQAIVHGFGEHVPPGVHVHWLTLVGLDRTIPHRGIAVLSDAREMLATAKVDQRVKVFRPITRKIRQTKIIT